MPPATVDPAAAVVTALIAAPLMEIPAYAQRLLGLGVSQDVFAEAGAILHAPARVRRLVGYVGHSMLGVGIVLLYATFFAAVAHNDHLALWGVLAGAVHGALGGIVVGAWPDLDPRMPEPVPAPGVFYRHYGRRDVLTFLGGHIWFGVLAGTLYAVLHRGIPATAAL